MNTIPGIYRREKHSGSTSGTFVLTMFLMITASLMLVRPAVPGMAKTFNPATPDDSDRCPFCGMFVAGYPDWLAQVHFSGSEPIFFDGVKDLMKYYFNMPRYEKTLRISDIRGIYVTDYYTTEPISAYEAWFVVGSDVLGPMGKELIPHRSRELAEEFIKDHRGELILTFGEITPELIRKL